MHSELVYSGHTSLQQAPLLRATLQAGVVCAVVHLVDMASGRYHFLPLFCRKLVAGFAISEAFQDFARLQGRYDLVEMDNKPGFAQKKAAEMPGSAAPNGAKVRGASGRETRRSIILVASMQCRQCPGRRTSLSIQVLS